MYSYAVDDIFFFNFTRFYSALCYTVSYVYDHNLQMLIMSEPYFCYEFVIVNYY